MQKHTPHLAKDHSLNSQGVMLLATSLSRPGFGCFFFFFFFVGPSLFSYNYTKITETASHCAEQTANCLFPEWPSLSHTQLL